MKLAAGDGFGLWHVVAFGKTNPDGDGIFYCKAYIRLCRLHGLNFETLGATRKVHSTV